MIAVKIAGSTVCLMDIKEERLPIMDAPTHGNATPASACEYQVNVPNRGALQGLPDDVVVERRAGGPALRRGQRRMNAAFNYPPSWQTDPNLGY